MVLVEERVEPGPRESRYPAGGLDIPVRPPDQSLQVLSLDPSEAGLPGIEAIVWNGIFAPAGTPPPVLQILHREIVKAYNAPDVKKQVQDTGGEVVADTPQEFAAFVRAEGAKWTKVIRDANIKPE